MVVVPALAEHEQRDKPIVASLVTRTVVLVTEHVADRVHAEGRVLVREDPDEPAPHETLDARLPRPADAVADRKGDPERQHDPPQVEAVDSAHETAHV